VLPSGSRNANNVLRSFRVIVGRAGLNAGDNAGDWTPREMSHSFVSLLSDSGVPIEAIARLVGHAGGSEVTETVYRKQIRPVLLDGAEVMDRNLRTGSSAPMSLTLSLSLAGGPN
jgi:integrase